MERSTPSELYTEIHSKKIQGLTACIYKDGQAEILIDGEQLCSLYINSQQIDIGEKHIDIPFMPDDTLENRTLKVMKELEKYFSSSEELEKRYKDSNLMGYLDREFKNKRAVAYINELSVEVIFSDLERNELKSFYDRTDLKKKTHLSL